MNWACCVLKVVCEDTEQRKWYLMSEMRGHYQPKESFVMLMYGVSFKERQSSFILFIIKLNFIILLLSFSLLKECPGNVFKKQGAQIKCFYTPGDCERHLFLWRWIL